MLFGLLFIASVAAATPQSKCQRVFGGVWRLRTSPRAFFEVYRIKEGFQLSKTLAEDATAKALRLGDHSFDIVSEFEQFAYLA
ncbi:MAG TPA: hypothetical protein VFX76_00155, partial [Roseiflexaceae bacterium]|nr:hypothetical protein [Roseiflexaceae bacterium]